MARLTFIFAFCFILHYAYSFEVLPPLMPRDMCPLKECYPSIEEKAFDIGHIATILNARTFDSIITTLPKLTFVQRLEVREEFKKNHKGKDIPDVINMKENWLSTSFKEGYGILIQPPQYTFAVHLREAIEANDVDTIIEILFTVNNLGIWLIKESYDTFNGDIESHVHKYIKNNLLADLIYKRLTHGRRERGLTYNPGEAAMAAMDICHHLNSDWQKRFNSYLVKDSYEQLLTMFEEIAKCSGLTNIYTFLQKWTSTHMRLHYKHIVKCVHDPHKFLARRLRKSIVNYNKKHVLRILLGRAEIDLMDIETQYLKLKKNVSKSNIYADIQKISARPNFRRLLTAVLAERITA